MIINGWLHTGDIGHLDADGYLTLVGRSKDMIIRGGENIYPKEIEDVLTSDPAVWRRRSSVFPTTNGARPSPPTSNRDRVTPSMPKCCMRFAQANSPATNAPPRSP